MAEDNNTEKDKKMDLGKRYKRDAERLDERYQKEDEKLQNQEVALGKKLMEGKISSQKYQEEIALLRGKRFQNQNKFNEKKQELTSLSDDITSDIRFIESANIDNIDSNGPNGSTYSHDEYDAAKRLRARMQEGDEFYDGLTFEQRRKIKQKIGEIERTYEIDDPRIRISALRKKGADQETIDQWVSYYRNHRLSGQEAKRDDGELTRRARKSQEYLDNVEEKLKNNTFLKKQDQDSPPTPEEIEKNRRENERYYQQRERRFGKIREKRQKEQQEVELKNQKRAEKRAVRQEKRRKRRVRKNIRRGLARPSNSGQPGNIPKWKSRRSIFQKMDRKGRVTYRNRQQDESIYFYLFKRGILHLVMNSPPIRAIRSALEAVETVEQVGGQISTASPTVGFINRLKRIRNGYKIIANIDTHDVLRLNRLERYVDRKVTPIKGAYRRGIAQPTRIFYKRRIKPITGGIYSGVKFVGRGVDYVSGGITGGLAPAAALGVATGGNPIAMASGFAYGASVEIGSKAAFDTAKRTAKRFSTLEMNGAGKEIWRTRLKEAQINNQLSVSARRNALYARKPGLMTKMAGVPRRFALFRAGRSMGVGALIGAIIAPQLGVAAGVGIGVAAVGAGAASYIASKNSHIINKITRAPTFKGAKWGTIGATAAFASVSIAGGNAVVAGLIAGTAAAGVGYAAAKFFPKGNGSFLKAMKSPALMYLSMADTGIYLRRTLDRLGRYDNFWELLKGETLSVNGLMNIMYASTGVANLAQMYAMTGKGMLTFMKGASFLPGRIGSRSGAIAQMMSKNPGALGVARWAGAGSVIGTIIGSIIGLAMGGGVGAVLGASLGATIGTFVGAGIGLAAGGVLTFFSGGTLSWTVVPLVKAGSFIGGVIGGIFGGIGGASAEKAANNMLRSMGASLNAVMSSINVFNALVSLININFNKKWNAETMIAVAFAMLPLASLISQGSQGNSIYNTSEERIRQQEEQSQGINSPVILASTDYIYREDEVASKFKSEYSRGPNDLSKNSLIILNQVEKGYWNLYNQNKDVNNYQYLSWKSCMEDKNDSNICDSKIDLSKDTLYWPIEFISESYEISGFNFENKEGNFSNLNALVRYNSSYLVKVEGGFNIDNVVVGSIALISYSENNYLYPSQIGIVYQINPGYISVLEVNSLQKMNKYYVNEDKFTNNSTGMNITGFINPQR